MVEAEWAKGEGRCGDVERLRDAGLYGVLAWLPRGGRRGWWPHL